MEKFLYRDFSINDVKQVASLITQLGYPTSVKEMEERMLYINKSNDYKTFVVCNSNNNVIGILGLSIYRPYELNNLGLRIEVLCVDESYRNKGIGTHLIKLAEDFSKEIGAKQIKFLSNKKRKNAHKLYKILGYEDSRYGFYKER